MPVLLFYGSATPVLLGLATLAAVGRQFPAGRRTVWLRACLVASFRPDEASQSASKGAESPDFGLPGAAGRPNVLIGQPRRGAASPAAPTRHWKRRELTDLLCPSNNSQTQLCYNPPYPDNGSFSTSVRFWGGRRCPPLARAGPFFPRIYVSIV